MIDKIIEGQTLDVDTVSGATFSSRGIISAVKNALTGEKDTSDDRTGAVRPDSGGSRKLSQCGAGRRCGSV